MNEIIFNCSNCNQPLESPEDMIGQQVDCPHCRARIQIPAPKHAHSAYPKPSRVSGNKLHYIATPTILVILLALALPFFGVSCNDQKLMSTTGYNLLNNGFSNNPLQEGSELESSNPAAVFYFCIFIIAVAGALATISSFKLAYRRRENLRQVGIGVIVAGIIAVLSLGYYFGIMWEGEINTNQTQSVEKTEGFEGVGASIAASMNISVNMDAGYYLMLAGMILGLGGLAIPPSFEAPTNKKRIVEGSISSSIAGLLIIYNIVMCLTALGNSARFSSPDEMNFGSSFATTEETEQSREPSPDIVKKTTQKKQEQFELSNRTRTGSRSNKPDSYVTDETFLGFHLGCSREEAKRVISRGPNTVKLVTEDRGQKQINFWNNHRLKGADGTFMRFWKGKLYSVGVVFSGNNEDMEHLCEVLEHKLTGKYGSPQEQIAVGKKLVWDEDRIVIEMKQNIGIMEDGIVYVAAVHKQLSNLAQSSKMDAEAKALGEF